MFSRYVAQIVSNILITKMIHHLTFFIITNMQFNKHFQIITYFYSFSCSSICLILSVQPVLKTYSFHHAVWAQLRSCFYSKPADGLLNRVHILRKQVMWLVLIRLINLMDRQDAALSSCKLWKLINDRGLGSSES